jgi:hypothetical protein
MSNFRKMKNSQLKSMWEDFKDKRAKDEFFSDQEEGYLTMLQREEILNVLFSRLKLRF